MWITNLKKLHLKLWLLTIVSTMLFIGCSDPEAEANKLFMKASSLVGDSEILQNNENAKTAEDHYKSLDKFYELRQEALKSIQEIPVQYPGTTMASLILSEQLIVKGHSIKELRESIAKPDMDYNESILRCQDRAVAIHLALGADPNVRVKSPYQNAAYPNLTSSALSYTIYRGDYSISYNLLFKGANPNPSGDFKSPLEEAMSFDGGVSFELISELIKKGANVNAKNKNGTTPIDLANSRGILDLALVRGDKEIAELLIANGADVNANIGGWTPLHGAARNGHKEFVELLIAAGADVNAKTDGGQTPLDSANREDKTETADLLRKHGGKTAEELKAEGK